MAHQLSPILECSESLSTTSSTTLTQPPTLHTIPPELLLNIITHLPPSIYLALIQTSQYMKSFFTHHASTICNAYILQHHALEASLLQSKYMLSPHDNQTWLTPIHISLTLAEDRSFPSSSLSPSTLALREKLLLSTPGPQYLYFLTNPKTSQELRTRIDMVYEPALNNALPSFEIPKWKPSPEKETYFMWCLERYITVPFLEDCGDFAEEFISFSSSKEKVSPKLRVKSRIQHRIQKLTKLIHRNPTTKTPVLLFGEIPPNSSSLDEKAAKDSPHSFGNGLLWYHGNSGVFPFYNQEDNINNTETKSKGSCFQRLRRRVSSVGKLVRRVVRKNACTGERDFESLGGEEDGMDRLERRFW